MNLKHIFEFLNVEISLYLAWLITASKIEPCYETSKIGSTQTRMKIHQASSIRPIRNKLLTDEYIRRGISTSESTHV
jgi:hypothetical protein